MELQNQNENEEKLPEEELDKEEFEEKEQAITSERDEGHEAQPEQTEQQSQAPTEAPATFYPGQQATLSPAQEKTLDPLKVIEAALFMSTKPVSTIELGKLVGIAAPGFVEDMVKKLAQHYDERQSAVAIVNDNGWIMKLKPEYAYKVRDFAQEAELSPGALKVLAFVSQHEGITQSKAVDMIGTTVYQYGEELSAEGWITRDKNGRTRVLRTTKKFKEHFGK